MNKEIVYRKLGENSFLGWVAIITLHQQKFT